jgi:protein TonB
MRHPTLRLRPIIIATALATVLAPNARSERFEEIKAAAIYHPYPDYPVDARRAQHLTGSGIILAKVDQKTGKVTSVMMEKSTGHKILDDAALSAFRQWRFRPGTSIRQFHAPVNFILMER